MKALIISANRFEDSELLVPYYRLREEGLAVDIASLTKGLIKGKHGYEIEANVAIAEVRSDQYSALVLPAARHRRRCGKTSGCSMLSAPSSRPASPFPPSATDRRF